MTNWIRDQLSEDNIWDLVRGDALAIHVPNYYAQAFCEKISQFMTDAQAFDYKHDVRQSDGTYKMEDYRIQGFMTPFTSVVTANSNREEIEEEYFSRGKKLYEQWSQACGENYNPIETLQKDLREIWQHQVRPAMWNRKPLYAGTLRRTLANAKRMQDMPHVDSIDVPFNRRAQLSNIVYTQTPESGGELFVYRQKPGNHKQTKTFERSVTATWYENARRRGDYVSIAPRPGDLVMINTRMPHGVNVFSEGTREQVTSFSGLDDSLHLNFWS